MDREKLIIRRASRDDAPTVIRFLRALADYEHLPGPDEEGQLRLLEHGWPEDNSVPKFRAWLAEGEDGECLGCAITTENYSTFLSKPTLYLEDLIVLPEARRHGVGSALLKYLMKLAKKEGYGRMEWVVLDWNNPALDFYFRMGASYLPEWRCYRITL